MQKLTDLDLEKTILGCIVFDNDILVEIIDKINPEYFSLKTNQLLYSIMCDLYNNNEPIDLITINQKSMGKGIDTKYVVSLSDGIITSKVAIHHSKILHDLYIKRQVLEFNHEIKDKIDNGGDAGELLSEMVDIAFRLSSGRSDNVKPLKKVMKASISQIEQSNGNKGITGIRTNLTDIDALLCGLKPKLYILAGRPGTGKTAFALNVAINAGLENKKVLIFELEMPDEEIGIRMLASETGTNTQMLENGFVKDDSWPKILGKVSDMAETDVFVDDSGTQTDIDIWTKAKRHKIKYGLDLVIVDYLQLVTSAKKVNSRQLEIGEISRNFKKMVKDLNVPVIALAQLSRACEIEKRQPRLSDLRESGDIEQDADVVCFLDHPHSRDDEEPESTMCAIFAKHRGGKKGYVELHWKPETTKFSDAYQPVRG